MNEEVLDTKSKIISTASHLFAVRGFDGVSIRDIAKAADVNLAAVNYHFKTKTVSMDILYTMPSAGSKTG